MSSPRALCPSCGQYRDYSCARAARRAELRGKRCHKCANHKKNQQDLVLGFSEAEFNSIQRTARGRKKYWNLSIADLHDIWERQDGKCAMTGAAMRKYPRTWSVDRLDNYCGYTPGNIQLVLKQVNMMRGSLSVEEFAAYCQAVVSNRSNHETN